VKDAEDIQRLVPPGVVAEGVGDDVGQAGRGLVCIAEFQGKIETAREARGEGDRPSTIVLQSRPWRTNDADRWSAFQQVSSAPALAADPR